MNQTQSSQFSFDTALALLESGDHFPVDFDMAWQWVGYSKKSNARKTLVENFEQGFDFCSSISKNAQRGRPSEFIHLTLDCFKSFCMMAGTEKGKEVRRYFLNCERKLKEVLTDDSLSLDILEHRLAARFEQRFVAIEDRLQQLETEINRKAGSSQTLTLVPTIEKYLYTAAETFPNQQLIVNFLKQRCDEKFSAYELAQLLSIPYNSIRRILPNMYRQGLINKEFNSKFINCNRRVPRHLYLACGEIDSHQGEQGEQGRGQRVKG